MQLLIWTRLGILCGMLFMNVPAAISQIISEAYKKNTQYQVEKWQVQDLRFKGKIDKATNPFDVVFGAVYTGPEGQVLNVPGFYDGNNEWVARFSANLEGKWIFETYSSLASLSGHRGEITIVANTRPNQHGSVIIDPSNPQSFIYEDGTPHFMLAFELDWLFALDYENADAIPRTQQILKNVKENGFNHVVANIYAYDVGWKVAEDVPDKYFFGKPEYTAWEGTNDQPDYSRLNLNLFQHWDRVIAHMQEIGLDAHLMIYVWNKLVNWPDMYDKGDNLYFDYIINRFQAFPNVIWDVSKEALDYDRADPPYIMERIERIRKRDSFGRLLTVHDYEFNSRNPEKVDFISIQSWRSDLYSLMMRGRRFHSDKAVVNIEHGGYEEGPYRSFVGNYTSAETCLVRTYECVFAGVYGSYYWQNAAWNIVIYDPFEEGHDFDAPRFDYYKHMAGLFETYDLNTFTPSYPKITTNNKQGVDNFATNGYILFNGEGTYLMFIPAISERVAAVLPEPKSGKVKAKWFNIYTGEYRDSGSRNWTQWMEMVSPWQFTDSVLIIEEEQI